MNLLSLTFFLLAALGSAINAAYYGEFGVAAAHKSQELSQVKFVEFGVQKPLTKSFDTRLGIGGWSDKTSYPNVRNSIYGTYQFMLQTKPVQGGMYAHYAVGPSVISHPDSLLGSHLQVCHTVGFGIADVREVRIGLVYKHFSNAGLKRPNSGRDLVGIEVQF